MYIEWDRDSRECNRQQGRVRVQEKCEIAGENKNRRRSMIKLSHMSCSETTVLNCNNTVNFFELIFQIHVPQSS